MKLLTYNVGGLIQKAQHVEKVMSLLDAFIGVITETWVNETATIPLSRSMEHVIRPQTVSQATPTRKFAARGGVAAVLPPLLRYRVLRRLSHANYQLMSISTMKISVVGAYISPCISKEDVSNALDWILQAASGPTIVLGDFNARHKTWDSKTYPRGTSLFEWAQSLKWNINAPSSASHRTRQGESKIDLVLVKNLETTQAQAMHSSWSGASDHYPAMTTTKL